MGAHREQEIQRGYYARTSSSYETWHVGERDEHSLALSVLEALIGHYQFHSALDVGAGTGRAVVRLREHLPGLRCVGVEPVAELRAIGYRKGLPSEALIPGDAMSLPFRDGEFEIVSEFGMLHHVPDPERAVAEMFRVASKGVFISDSNNFGQGSFLARVAKNILRVGFLWPLADFLKTRGRGFTVSDGDGLAYSYSVFNNQTQIRTYSSTVHLFNTAGGWGNPIWSHPHICLLAIKKGAVTDATSRGVPRHSESS